MKSILRLYIIGFLVALAFIPMLSHAAVIVIAPTGSTSGSLQITNDIVFTITSNGNAAFFVFDEWVISDGSMTFSTLSPMASISLNGAAPMSKSMGLIDNLTMTQGQMTPNDGLLAIANGLDTIPVITGNTLTLRAGSYSLSAVSNFNPQTNQTFTGNMFVVDSSVAGQRISNIVAVPEPATNALILAGMATIFATLRRKLG